MFTKIVSTVSVLLAVSVHVNGHTLMTPALGVQGAGARSDVQRLAKTGGCGDMDVASNIDTSTPVAAAADGTFTVTATNFNRLTDGSRQLTATMDSTGTGNNFNGAVTISQNGDNRPKSLGSEQIVAALPAGTTCSGGASGNLCLVSFQNGARQGFGNCVVVSQGAAAGGATAGTGATAAGAGAATGSTVTAAGAGTGASDTSGVGAATGSTGASNTSAVGAATGSTGAEVGTGTGASDTSAVGAATGSTGVEAGAGTGASGSSALGATTGSTATSGTGVSVGNTAGTDVGAGVNGAASGAGVATSGTGVSAGNTAGTGVGAGVNGAASGAGVATSGSTTASTGQAVSQAGSRAARALLAELEARGEDSLDLVRRGIVDWIWA